MSKSIDTPIVVKDIDESGLRSVGPIKRRPWWKFGGADYSFVTVNDGYPASTGSSAGYDSKNDSTDSLNSHHNVYNNAESKEIYKPIEGYEGAHRFDPSFKWDPAEEKKLVKTVSLYILFSGGR
jgi:hypothetical protein